MSSLTGPSLDPLRFPQRKSVRLREHDYSSGLYFITICVRERRPILCRVKRGRVFLTSVGQIVQDEWLGTNQIRLDARVDAFVVMPDHFHGIVELGGGLGSRAHAVRPYLDRGHAVRPNLGQVVAGFKSACTRRYRGIAGNPAGALWQRGYYEHVVRGAKQLERIRRYIADNPRRWRTRNYVS